MLDDHALHELLSGVKDGSLEPEKAALLLKEQALNGELGYARPDFARSLMTGQGEVIYGAGKSAAQIAAITRELRHCGQERVLITRLSPAKARELESLEDFTYDETSSLGYAGALPEPDGMGTVVVACAGTSDLYAAEEAALTAQFYGNEVTRLYDVGVAGLHRLLSQVPALQQAAVVISVAGMEGALTSVIGGLVRCPVIGVPTSVGYGASLQGMAALLSMLNSCAPGVCVVNIDNGFGAGALASRINHPQLKSADAALNLPGRQR